VWQREWRRAGRPASRAPTAKAVQEQRRRRRRRRRWHPRDVVPRLIMPLPLAGRAIDTRARATASRFVSPRGGLGRPQSVTRRPRVANYQRRRGSNFSEGSDGNARKSVKNMLYTELLLFALSKLNS